MYDIFTYEFTIKINHSCNVGKNIPFVPWILWVHRKKSSTWLASWDDIQTQTSGGYSKKKKRISPVQGWFQGPRIMGPPLVSFPHYSHTTPTRIPKDMGIVWEAYHKRVPLLGVPENPIDRFAGSPFIAEGVSFWFLVWGEDIDRFCRMIISHQLLISLKI